MICGVTMDGGFGVLVPQLVKPETPSLQLTSFKKNVLGGLGVSMDCISVELVI